MAVSLLSGTVQRTWTIDADGASHVVQLSHNTITGHRLLAVDGEDVAGTEGHTTALSNSAQLLFTIGRARGQVNIEPRGTGFNYTCHVDGMRCEEDTERVGTGRGPADGAALDIRVSSAEVGVDEGGRRVIYYLLRTQRMTVRARPAAAAAARRTAPRPPRARHAGPAPPPTPRSRRTAASTTCTAASATSST